MADTFRIKRRAVGGAAGAPATLAAAEIAFNEQDETLYYGKGNNGSGVATSVIPIASKAAVLGGGGAATSAFSASPAGAGSVANETMTKMIFDSATFNVGSYFNTSSVGGRRRPVCIGCRPQLDLPWAVARHANAD